MKQPKKIKREHKIEISKLNSNIDLSKYRLISESDEEFVLTDSVTYKERIVIKR